MLGRPSSIVIILTALGFLTGACQPDPEVMKKKTARYGHTIKDSADAAAACLNLAEEATPVKMVDPATLQVRKIVANERQLDASGLISNNIAVLDAAWDPNADLTFYRGCNEDDECIEGILRSPEGKASNHREEGFPFGTITIAARACVWADRAQPADPSRKVTLADDDKSALFCGDPKKTFFHQNTPESEALREMAIEQRKLRRIVGRIARSAQNDMQRYLKKTESLGLAGNTGPDAALRRSVQENLANREGYALAFLGPGLEKKIQRRGKLAEKMQKVAPKGLNLAGGSSSLCLTSGDVKKLTDVAHHIDKKNCRGKWVDDFGGYCDSGADAAGPKLELSGGTNGSGGGVATAGGAGDGGKTQILVDAGGGETQILVDAGGGVTDFAPSDGGTDTIAPVDPSPGGSTPMADSIAHTGNNPSVTQPPAIDQRMLACQRVGGVWRADRSTCVHATGRNCPTGFRNARMGIVNYCESESDPIMADLQERYACVRGGYNWIDTQQHCIVGDTAPLQAAQCQSFNYIIPGPTPAETITFDFPLRWSAQEPGLADRQPPYCAYLGASRWMGKEQLIFHCLRLGLFSDGSACVPARPPKHPDTGDGWDAEAIAIAAGTIAAGVGMLGLGINATWKYFWPDSHPNFRKGAKKVSWGLLIAGALTAGIAGIVDATTLAEGTESPAMTLKKKLDEKTDLAIKAREKLRKKQERLAEELRRAAEAQ